MSSLQEMEHDGSASSLNQNRASMMFSPPWALMFEGSFEDAKQVSAVQNKWLIVNLQSPKEFASHMLNRDVWADKAVAEVISWNFVFWQITNDNSEGMKVATYYNSDSFPEILVLDPITGRKMRSWKGMVDSESFLEDLMQFMDSGPAENLYGKPPSTRNTTTDRISAHAVMTEDEELQLALAASMLTTEDRTVGDGTLLQCDELDETHDFSEANEMFDSYPDLPPEPKDVDRSLVCRVGVRLPDGRRVERSFLRTDSIRLLWSFCRSQLEEAEVPRFRLLLSIPGASTYFEYESALTFEESKLANSMVSLIWE